jgi:hypothetical protein
LSPVRRLVLLQWLVSFVAVAPEAVAAPMVAAAGKPAAYVGLWLMAIPVGMIVGNLAAVWALSAAARRRSLFPAAICVPSLLTVFLMRPSFGLALGLLAGSGIASCYSLELDRRLRNAIAVPLRGRAFAFNGTGLMVSQGLGFVSAGLLAEFLSPFLAIGISGIGGVLAVCLVRVPRPDGHHAVDAEGEAPDASTSQLPTRASDNGQLP